MIKKIVIFDFDGTLCFTPEPVEGKKIWFEKTGTVFPYPGWWSKKETLDMDIFYIPVNPFVYKKYFNLGFAADTPNGLVVPVIKNADQKSILEISKEIIFSLSVIQQSHSSQRLFILSVLLNFIL